MSSQATTPSVLQTRRTLLGGAGAATAFGILASQSAVAQDASPAVGSSQADHPFVGTWIVDRNPSDASEIPTFIVVTADGGIIDPTVGGAGVWEATGSDTAAMTLAGTIAEISGYFIVRGSVAIDEGGMTATAPSSSTIIAADGTILDQQADTTAHFTRLAIEPQDAVGQPLSGFPAWSPQVRATPDSD